MEVVGNVVTYPLYVTMSSPYRLQAGINSLSIERAVKAGQMYTSWRSIDVLMAL